MGNKSFVFRFDDVEVREREFTLTKAGKVLAVEPKAFRALLFLLHNPQRLISKEELLNSLWGDAAVTEGSLTRCIWLLRRLLEDDIHEPRYIETVATVGYRFVCPVEVSEDGPPRRITRGTERRGAPRSRSRWRWAAAAAASLAMAMIAALILRWRIPPGVPVVESVTQLTDDGQRKDWMVSDGLRIYFQQKVPFRIGQVSVTGGATAPVETRFTASFLGGITKDGSALLVDGTNSPATLGGALDSGTLWLIPMPAGEARRLGNIDALDVDTFPDGRIIYAQPAWEGIDTDWFVAGKDGSNPRKLVSLPGEEGHVSVSPDGQRIILTQEVIGDRRLIEIAADGAGRREIRRLGEVEQNFRWTADGKHLVYQSGTTLQSDIWLLPMQTGILHRGGNPIRLTNGPLPYTLPCPSRDGKQIFVLGTIQRGELVRYDMKSKQFVPFLAGISATDPTFSRDGRWVAYVSYPDHTLWRSRSDGSERMQLTYAPLGVRYPFISPDGTKVAFDTEKGEVFLVDMEGQTSRKILDNAVSPTWSPDGNYLYAYQFDFSSPGGRRGLVVDLRNGKKTSFLILIG